MYLVGMQKSIKVEQYKKTHLLCVLLLIMSWSTQEWQKKP